MGGHASTRGTNDVADKTSNLSPRAADLSSQLVPLCRIKPDLSSRHLVKGWIDRAMFSVVYGESNVGKTFFAIDLALHVGAACDWHGYRIADGDSFAGPAIYVACEGGTGINNRLEAIRRKRSDLAERCEKNDGFLLMPTTLDLCTSEDASHLADALAAIDPRPVLVVIDTLARAMGNGDENTARDMGSFIRGIDQLRVKTGAHVMVIHHSGKDTSKGARGSGSLRAAADTEIEITRCGDHILATTKKQRDMPRCAVFAYKLQNVLIGLDEDGDDVTSAIVEQAEVPASRAPLLKGQALIAMQAFGDAFKDHGEFKYSKDFSRNLQCVSLDQWRQACDRRSLANGSSESASRQAFRRAWKSLQEKGIVHVTEGFAWKCHEA